MPEREGVRINKYLADKGIVSRRKADELIEAGLVRVNGRNAYIGQRVGEGDIVEVAEEVSKIQKAFQYFAYYKPQGIVTHSAGPGEKDIAAVLKLSRDITPVGRLDKDSEGLILLTNDGRIVGKLLEPGNLKEKEYEVEVDKPILGADLMRLERGVNIEGYKTKRAKAVRVGKTSFLLTIVEGKKHQVRRMAGAVGYQVRNLKRVRIGSITLGSLANGKLRPIEGAELERLFADTGIKRQSRPRPKA